MSAPSGLGHTASIASAECPCIRIVDARLAPRNTRIVLPIVFGDDQTLRVMIRTEQVETGRGKEKAIGLFATFCPFCGEPYATDSGK